MRLDDDWFTVGGQIQVKGVLQRSLAKNIKRGRVELSQLTGKETLLKL